MSMDRDNQARGQLAVRQPTLDWAHRASAGTLDKVRWVDSSIDVSKRSKGRFQRAETGELQFQQRSYGGMLPPSIAHAAAAAQEAGHVTAWEVLILLFARAEWMVESREEVWTPWSPVPRLLAQLVEAFGVEPSLHGYQAEGLARLVALLPRWHPHRGTVRRAEEILEATGQEHQVHGVYERDATSDQLDDEAFACHGEGWWLARTEPGAEPAFRIKDGVLCFQPKATQGAPESAKDPKRKRDLKAPPRYRAPRGDIVLRTRAGNPLPLELFRLLPAWTVVRPVIATEE